jgi:hypothetical protein
MSKKVPIQCAPDIQYVQRGCLYNVTDGRKQQLTGKMWWYDQFAIAILSIWQWYQLLA